MKANYVIVGTDEYGEDFVYVQPEDGKTLWFIDDAEYHVECLSHYTSSYSYRIARLSFLD